MKRIRMAASAAALLSIAISLSGTASAEDYTTLLADPNVVFDTVSYVPGAVTANPAGQPGAAKIYTHSDGRSITETVWVLGDPAAATAAAGAAQRAAGIANATSEPIEVGTGGTLISGTTANGSQSLTLLAFTQGKAAATIAFASPVSDPANQAVAIELGQAQDALIKTRMGG